MKSRSIFYSLILIALVALGFVFQPVEARHFFQDWTLWYEPVLGGIVCGLVAALLGYYVLLNRIVFIGLAVSQGAGFGIFLSFWVVGMFGWSIHSTWFSLLAGFIFSSLTAFLFTRAKKSRSTTDESLIGLIYCVASGLIVFLGDRISEGRHEIENILFGNAVAVTTSDLLTLLGIAGAILALHSILRRKFIYASADPDFLAIRGVNVRFLKVLLYATLTLGITATMRVIGSLPVFTLMVVPAWVGLRKSLGISESLRVSLLLGASIPPIGYYLSFLYSFPTGASMIVVALVYAGFSFFPVPFSLRSQNAQG